MSFTPLSGHRDKPHSTTTLISPRCEAGAAPLPLGAPPIELVLSILPAARRSERRPPVAVFRREPEVEMPSSINDEGSMVRLGRREGV